MAVDDLGPGSTPTPPQKPLKQKVEAGKCPLFCSRCGSEAELATIATWRAIRCLNQSCGHVDWEDERGRARR